MKKFCVLLFFGFYGTGLWAQDSAKASDSVSQKLFFTASISSITGFGAGVEYMLSKKLFFGIMAGGSSPDFFRPPYKGNQINGRVFMGVQVARTALIIGGYAGNYDFDQDVQVASIASITVSGRYQVDARGRWFAEVGVAPMIPDHKVTSGVRIPSQIKPPFVFLSVFYRFKDKQPEKPEEPENDPYSYPPVFY